MCRESSANKSLSSWEPRTLTKGKEGSMPRMTSFPFSWFPALHITKTRKNLCGSRNGNEGVRIHNWAKVLQLPAWERKTDYMI